MKIISARVFEKRNFGLRKGYKENILTNFGPAFKIDMKFKLNDLPTTDWGNIIHVTNGGDGGSKGNRYPALFVHKDSYFRFTSCIDDAANYQLCRCVHPGNLEGGPNAGIRANPVLEISQFQNLFLLYGFRANPSVGPTLQVSGVDAST